MPDPSGVTPARSNSATREEIAVANGSDRVARGVGQPRVTGLVHPGRSDDDQTGPVGIADQDRGQGRAKSPRGDRQHSAECGIEITFRDDRGDRGGKERPGIAGG